MPRTHRPKKTRCGRILSYGRLTIVKLLVEARPPLVRLSSSWPPLCSILQHPPFTMISLFRGNNCRSSRGQPLGKNRPPLEDRRRLLAPARRRLKQPKKKASDTFSPSSVSMVDGVVVVRHRRRVHRPRKRLNTWESCDGGESRRDTRR